MISRFLTLFNTAATVDPVGWDDLFTEFSRAVAFKGDDHPGWAPTEFEPATRSLATVKRVHAMVLDYDNTDPATKKRLQSPVSLDDAELLWLEYFGLIHTTRKHTADWPRFRVILPYTRHVSPFEQTGMWYRVNAHVGGTLDPSPKDPSRFWYTPGTADHAGACFEARRLTGALFDPDEWLTKPDPTLSGQPIGDATPINGTIRETRARAYVRKMPEAVSGQDGHGATFAVARKLIADFGLDEDTAFRVIITEHNPRCRPPWSEKEIRHKIKQALRARVKNPVAPDRDTIRRSTSAPNAYSPERAAAEREDAQAPAPITTTAPPARARAAGDDDDEPPVPAETTPVDDDTWQNLLRTNTQGKLTKDPGNASVLLRHHPEWRGCFEYNAFSDQVHWARRPPDIGFMRPEAGERLQDHHAVLVHHWFARCHGVSFPKSALWDAIIEAAHSNTVHPVRDYLTELVWDGKQRLSRWLTSYLGADDTDYTAAVGRWWLVSAVARAFQPGCQADHMLILEGAQGAGKSTAMRIIGDAWYLGSLPDIRDRDRAAAVLQGNWIVEVGELDAFKGAAATRVKDFLTQPFDEYRAAYARFPSRRPRGCVFVGTTNETSYLQDASGARRYWPVRVTRLARAELARDRDQLWAEARLAYESGEQWHPTDDMLPILAEQQEERFDEDEWLPRIASWVQGGDLPFPRDAFTIGDVMAGALSLEPGKWDRSAQTRVGSCLRRLGLKRRLITEGTARVRKYYA